MNQKGFSPIFIIAIAVFIVISILAWGIHASKNSTKKPATSQNIPVKKDCVSTSLGGCDDDQNFYKWKDDGLP